MLFLLALLATAKALNPPHPMITEPPTPVRRDLFDQYGSSINGILSSLGSAIPSYVASGVPNFFQDFPTGDQVQSSLGVDSSQLAAVPTQVLNIPSYANWTNGWNVRFHGNVYKQPQTSNQTLDKLANGFLINTNISSLPQSQQDQARNVTAEIYVVQQGNVAVSPINIGDTNVILPSNTTDEGDFDVFVPVQAPQNATTLSSHVGGASLGNATIYLVPEEGTTIISDIDDILRVTKIYDPEQGLLNSFARPFTPWQNMPDIYRNLTIGHFHYLTTTPEQATRIYMDYIFKTYPAGSFDTRPLNFTNADETLSVRKFLLEKIFRTFPKRKFVLVADTSNSDVMRDYPAMATEFPGQVSCIWLRNTSATDSDDKFPYDTSGFKNLNQSNYMFFVNSDDLQGLDPSKQCYNTSVPQNLTFGYQGITASTTAVNASATHTAGAAQLNAKWPLLSGLFMASLFL